MKRVLYMQAQKSLSTISGDRDLWFAQYRQELHERDYRSGLSAAEARGERNKAIDAAKYFLRMGLPVKQVAEGVGLSVEEIEKL